MSYGVLSTSLTGVPDNVDLEKLNSYQTADGVGFGDILTDFRDMARRFASFDWLSHPALSQIVQAICAPSTDPMLRWRQGDIGWSPATDDMLGAVTRQHRTVTGGQIPSARYMAAIGYTGEVLRPGPNHVKSGDVVSDLQAKADGAVERVRQELLRCLGLKAARAVPGSATGLAAGWVGGASQTYVPPAYEGTAFTSHSHYVGDGVAYADSATGRRNLFRAIWTTLREHGIESVPGAPIILLHGPDTLADVQADSEYVGRTAAGVVPGSTVTVADVPDYAHGRLRDSGIVCAQVGGIPDNYYLAVKSYGQLSPRNPVRLWAPGDIGFGPTLLDVDENTPLGLKTIVDLTCFVQFGFGIAAPEHGAAGLIGGGGTWTDPTIT